MNRSLQNQIFLEWTQAHGAILWKVARAYAGRDNPQHLYQDLLIALWEAIPLYRAESKPSTFIYRVALNRALNSIRTTRRKWISLDDIAPPPSPPAQDRDLIGQLYEAIGRLSEVDRSLALLHLDQLSYREIGEVLGLTEMNVGARLTRIRKRLAQLLQETD